MVARRLPAYVASWQSCLSDVKNVLLMASLEEFTTSCPNMWSLAKEAGDALAVPRDVWTQAAAAALPKAQRGLMTQAHKLATEHLLNLAPAHLRCCTGAGAGSWLMPPTSKDHVMADDHFATSLALRLHLPPNDDGSVTCLRARRDGSRCGAPLALTPGHSLYCHVGGCTVARHGAIRDWLARWLKVQGALAVMVEQAVPLSLIHI